MAEKINSCIGFDKSRNAVCVVCGGKIGFGIQENDEKDNPYVCIDMIEIEQNVGVGGNVEGIKAVEGRPVVRIIAYDPQSVTSIVKALMKAQDRLFNIKKNIKQL